MGKEPSIKWTRMLLSNVLCMKDITDHHNIAIALCRNLTAPMLCAKYFHNVICKVIARQRLVETRLRGVVVFCN
jgi:hypothetical protein